MAWTRIHQGQLSLHTRNLFSGPALDIQVIRYLVPTGIHKKQGIFDNVQFFGKLSLDEPTDTNTSG